MVSEKKDKDKRYKRGLSTPKAKVAKCVVLELGCGLGTKRIAPVRPTTTSPWRSAMKSSSLVTSK